MLCGELEMHGDRRFCVQSHVMSRIHPVKESKLFCVKVNMKCCSQTNLFPRSKMWMDSEKLELHTSHVSAYFPF